jgi:hypothetical protein
MTLEEGVPQTMQNRASLANPVLLSVFYCADSDYHASLSSNEATSSLTVIYDSLLAGVQVTTIAGDKETDTLAVQDCELISVIARRESIVVGVGVFQVDVSLAGTHGLILAPMTMVNIHVDHEDISAFKRAGRWGDQVVEEGAQVL